MIWLVVFGVIIIISIFLALRSMKDYQDIPMDNLKYSLYLIRNRAAFNEEVLSQFHQKIASLDSHFSFERLFKGAEEALVMFAPNSVMNNFSELQPLEIEDYLPDKNVTTSWVIKAVSQDQINITPD